MLVALPLLAIWRVGERGHLVEWILLTWVLLNYLYMGLTLRIEPSVKTPTELALDRPFAYYDDHNRMLALAFVWLTPGRWLSQAIIAFVLYWRLPTVEQVAGRMFREDPNEGSSMQHAGSSPESDGPDRTIDEAHAFHHALRRSDPTFKKLTLCTCAAAL